MKCDHTYHEQPLMERHTINLTKGKLHGGFFFFFFRIKDRDQSERNWSCGTGYGGKTAVVPKLGQNHG